MCRKLVSGADFKAILKPSIEVIWTVAPSSPYVIVCGLIQQFYNLGYAYGVYWKIVKPHAEQLHARKWSFFELLIEGNKLSFSFAAS